MDDRFVKLYGSIMDANWYTKPKTVALYIHLLLRAAHEPVKVGEAELQAGQAVIGYEKTARETGLTVQEVRTALKNLEVTGFITRNLTAKGNLVTIEKWAFEQVAKRKSNRVSNSNLTTNKNTLSKDKVYICDLEKIIEKWNMLGLSQVRKLIPGSEREAQLKRRISEYGMDAVLEALDNVRNSDFLMGKRTDFKATFDWFIGPKNFAKVYDGNYNDRKPEPDKPKIRF